MSSGDIDDVLGSAARLQQLLEGNDAFRDYYSHIGGLRILRAAIPYGAGISEAGDTIYIDHRLDTLFHGVDVSLALAYHEGTEWGLRALCGVGVDYENDPDGHRLANRAELDKLTELFPDHLDGYMNLWFAYDDFLDPQIRSIEKAPFDGRVPLDLAMYPYAGDELLEARIRRNFNVSTI